jgi:hypothetical protein
VQNENGQFASSPILTTTAAATRAADNAIMSNLANIGFNPTQGTIVVEFETMAQNATAVLYSIAGTAGNFMTVRRDTGTPANILSRVVFGSPQADINTGVAGALIVNKTAFGYQENNFAASINGSTPATDVSGTIPVVSAMYLGSDASSGNQLFGWLRRITYNPTRLSNTQIQALTA